MCVRTYGKFTYFIGTALLICVDTARSFVTSLVLHPQHLLYPDWIAPDDALDPVTRTIWKFKLVMLMNVLVVIFLLATC